MSNNITPKTRTDGFNFKAIIWVRDQVREISRDERLLLQYLATRVDQNNECFPKQARIADDLECSPRHVWNVLKSLKDKGLISSKRRRNTSALITLQIQDSHTGANPGLARTCESGFANICKVSNQKKVTNQNEVDLPTGGGAPTATAWEDSLKTQKQIRKEFLERLKRDYGKNWATSRPARLAVFCQLGRQHFPKYPYFAASKTFKPYHLNQLDHVFEVLGRYSADVLAYAFEHWSEISNRKTPTLAELENTSWVEVYKMWKQETDYETRKAMLNRVSANLAKEQAA